MFTIWTYGGCDIITHILRCVSHTINAPDTIWVCVRTIGLGCVLYSIIHAQIKQNIFSGVTPFLWFCFASTILLYNNEKVLVRDTIYQEQKIVENVPWALAFIAGTLSSCMHYLTKNIEHIFQTHLMRPTTNQDLFLGPDFFAKS